MQSLDNDIKSGKFKRVYLIYGEESFLVKEYENKLKESIIPAGAETMNLSVFDGKGFSGKEISEAIDTMPFFSEYRLVIVRDSGLFTTGRKDDTDLLAEYVKSIPDTSVLVFCNEKVDKRNALYKAVKKNGYVCEINMLKEKELTNCEILCRYGAVLDFSSDIAVTDDRSCYQLVIAGKIHQIFIVSLLCCNLSAVDIQHIADSLEGVKGNTDRQSNLRHRQGKSGQKVYVFHHKSAVLKDTQHTKVKHQRRNQRYLFAALLSGQVKIFDAFCPGVVQESGQHQQKHPDWFAPGIEKERKKKQNHIFPGFVWNGII